MPYSAYKFRSEAGRRHYYGHTSDPAARLARHQTTQNTYTREKDPWELVGYIAQLPTQTFQWEQILPRSGIK